MPTHLRSRRGRRGRGFVARAIIDHHNIAHEFTAGADDIADRLRRVVSGNEDERLLGHAASRESTALTIPPPAEIEFTRTCRRWRSDFSPVGANRISLSPSAN